MNFTCNKYGDVVVFVDGACPGNGFRGARAGVGVWFDDDHDLNVSSSMPGVQTNNNAEIYAAVIAIDMLLDYTNESCVEIVTDSIYLCNCVSKWIHKWKRNGWRNCRGKLVANKDMLEQLDNRINAMDSVIFTYVRAHNNIYGNEQADKLARKGADTFN
ncbi:ribonuclease H1-like [Myzus persicae]|uniref:ribonuclease H1-like n=1 Tax=Myzus persicae TaxID=13164 RepID=UPI000B9374EB|nr:ribonuclease H1-like [Myzus persicae]